MKLLFLLVLLFAASPVAASTGTASYYSDKLEGHTMSNGKPYDPCKLTCASWFYPLGTKLSVTSNGKTVVVTVTDRGPNKRLHRLIDLSGSAFKALANRRQGLIDVSVEKV